MDEKTPTRVEPGYLIQVEITYADETERFDVVIVPDDQADFQAGFLGEGTPLAKSVLGMPIGEEIPYFAGDARSVKVLSIKPTEKAPEDDAAARREEIMRQAAEEAERTSAMMFASSFSGKWGDYDPEAIENQKGSHSS